jgi:hypothetical protein
MTFTIYQTGRRPLDLDVLTLPDGRKARTVDRDELEIVLGKLGVKFTPGSGRDAMLLNYSLYLGEQRKSDPPIDPRPPRAA